MRYPWPLALSILVVASVSAAAQMPPATPTAELAFKNGKTHFRSGEPMMLEITFRPGQDGCWLVSSTSPSPMDVVEITPSDGAFRWRQGNGYGSDASSWSKLDADHPAVIRLTLNDLYRFDAKGTYSVSVRTSHLHCGAFAHATAEELTTNAVSFDVEPYPEAEEKELATSLEQQIRAAKCKADADKLAKQLEYLPGDDATRAKLSLTLHEKTFYPFGVDLGDSLWIARNREIVVSTLNKAIADPTQPESARFIPLLLELQRNQTLPSAQCCVMPATHAQPDPLAAGYMHEVALTLPQRTGESLIESALAVFEADAHGAENNSALAADYQQAREIVITHFGEVNEYTVDYVLRAYGQYLHDPRMVPALQSLVDHSSGIFSSNRVVAMKLLQELAPEGMDRYLVQEACADHPAMIKDVRDLTTAETLPEADTCLGNKLHSIFAQPASARSDLRLNQTLNYIARFADDVLVPQVRQAYMNRNPEDRRWDQTARGAAICYLMRWDAKDAAPLLAEYMPDGAKPDQFVLFNVVAPATSSAAGLRPYFRQWIQAHPANPAPAVYLLSQISNADDRAFLQQQLDALHEKYSVPFTKEDSQLEIELVAALIHGRTWDDSGDKGKQVARADCETAQCKAYFHVEN